MALQPFTPDGVNAKISELYALPDADLQAQAGEVRNDFNTWLADNFDLDAAQQSYFDTMDSRWKQFTADNASFAIANRRPVTLIQGKKDPATGKLIHTIPELTATFDSTGFSASGSFTIQIVYP